MQNSSHLGQIGSTDSLDIFKGGGEMGALMRSYKWESHPLGTPANWPLSLKANVRLMLNSGFPMFIWWTKELYMFNNDAYLPALGKKHPKALGARAREAWAEIWDQIGGITEDILQHGKEFYADSLLMYLERKDFIEETYWTFSYSPIFDDDGSINGIFCACSEVTNTMQGQRRLKTLKDLSDALAQVQTLELVGRTACKILSQNQQDLPFSLIYLCNNTGSEAKLMGKAGAIAPDFAPDVIHVAGADALWPLQEVFTTQRPLVNDLPALQGRAADTGCEKVAILPILKPGQEQVIGFFIAGINERLEYSESYAGFHDLLAGQIATSIASVHNKQEMLRQQEYLKDIFQQAPVGITMLRGPEYIVDIANPGVCEIWGRRQEDVLGRPVLEAIPEAFDQVKDLLDGVLLTGTPYVADELPVILERNGKMEEVFLNFVYHPLRDSGGDITGVIAIAIDISEQVRARQEIEKMNNELVATNADLDNFVYSASHDLRAPVSNIEGLVQELREYMPVEASSSAEVQQLITHMQSSIERFKRVVADLTKVAQIQRAAGEDIMAINLKDVIEEVCLDFEPVIMSTGAQIERHIAPGSIISFSAKNVRSVVYNLISNALKYSSPERKPHITLSTHCNHDYLVLTVADNGLGVKMADVNKMFSMFKRLHDHVEGSGIGLYIVKRIIENAGGKITVDSRIGEGTTFNIYFKRQ